MKKINVIVKEKTLLELAEDGTKGDIIDLKEITKVDMSFIESVIESGKDKIYQSKLEELKKTIEAQNEVELYKLKNEIDLLKKENISNIKIKEAEVQNSFNSQIAELNEKIKVLETNKENEIALLNSKHQSSMENLKAEETNKYHELEQKYNIIMSQYENQIKQSKLQLENDYNKKLAEIESKYKIDLANKDSEIEMIKLERDADKNKALMEQKAKFDEDIKTKEDIINNLQRAKASMNVKQTGEDLESWCDNEVTSYMQNGLLNCTWTKDNKVIKEEDESKGSKADYIFKVYASNKHEDNELLASVCLDMKDENPDSVNKRTNEFYYKALEKNREKKNCKYAVLVSNLEMDKPNVLPIFKVRDFENMYVVRPGYLMVFLNMIASLTTRFADLLTSKEKEKLELKAKLDVLEVFDDIKKTYLDKPLELLEKAIEDISKNSDSIKKACRNIDDQCERINKSYVHQIIEKLNKYELKLNKNIINVLD